MIAFLHEIFPQFGDEDVLCAVESSANGLHCVTLAFADYFAAKRTDPSVRQLRSLGHLLNEAVALDDDREEAACTP